MKIGLAIALRREQIGMTQQELADIVGVSKASISRWESGDISNMRRDRIQKLANALKVSPVSLLDEETDGLFEEIKNTAPDDDAKSRIIKFVSGLSEGQTHQLLAYLEGMLDESRRKEQEGQ